MINEENIIVARNKASAEKYLEEDIRRVCHDFKGATHNYYQSYLYWMYQQNEKFNETLTTEEITNYFLQGFNHPVWFRVRLEENPLDVSVDAREYFQKYAKSAGMFDYEFPLFPKEAAPFHGIEKKEEILPAAEKTKKVIAYRAKQLGVYISDAELESMDYWNSVFSIAALGYMKTAKEGAN